MTKLPAELCLFPNWTRAAAIARMRELVDDLPKDVAIRVRFEAMEQPAERTQLARLHAMFQQLAMQMGDDVGSVRGQMKELFGPYTVDGAGHKVLKSTRDYTEDEAATFCRVLEVNAAEMGYDLVQRGR